MDGLPRVHDGSREGERSQDQLERTLLAKVPDWIRNGKSLGTFTIDPGQTLTINHSLGRRVQGWIPMSLRKKSGGDTNNSGQISETKRSDTSLTLHLDTGGSPVRFELWVW